jgi:hypothetical protein
LLKCAKAESGVARAQLQLENVEAVMRATSELA